MKIKKEIKIKFIKPENAGKRVFKNFVRISLHASPH